MTQELNDPWTRLDTLFGALLELEDARRDSFIEAIGEENGLRTDLRSLLDAHRRNADEFLRPLSEVALDDVVGNRPRPEDQPLDVPIPEHRIIGEIHRGGQGIVYKAEHEPTGRIVAIKVIRHGGFASPSQRARFDRERRIVASLHHPNIVTLYHTGELACGRVSYTMEYVDGLPMHRWLRGAAQELPLRAKLDMFGQICAGIAYAHDRGVIHRDLKPSNVIIDRNGAPRVVDFGLAKVLEESRGEPLTLTGEIACTPEYAAPEQLTAANGEPDQRTDVYALGVLLYEMITGAHPYRTEGSVAEMLRQVLDVMPPSPATVSPEIDGDLARIAMKCLAKEPAERYPSVAALRLDVDRYLNDEPISARAPSAFYHARKFARRHRRSLVLVTVCAAVAIGGLVAAAVFANRGAENRAEITRALETERVRREIDHGRAELRDGQVAAAEERLWRVLLGRPAPPSPAHAADARTRAAWWGLWELYANHPCFATGTPAAIPITRIAIDGARTRFALLTEDGIVVWNAHDRVVESHWSQPGEQVAAIAFDADDRLNALWWSGSRASLRTLGATTPRWTATIPVGDDPPVVLSADGRVAAALGPDGTLTVHHAGDPNDLVLDGLNLPPASTRLALDPAGAVLAWQTLTETGVIDVATCATRTWPYPQPQGLGRLAIASNAAVIASAFGERLTLFGGPDEPKFLWPPSPGQITTITFEPEARSMWTAGLDRRLTHYHIDGDLEARDVHQFAGHRQAVTTATVTSDVVASADVGGTLKLWDKHFQTAFAPIANPPGGVHALAYDATGERIAIVGGAGPRGTQAIFVDGPRGRTHQLVGHTDVVAGVAFTPDGHGLITASYDHTIRRWDLRDGTSRVFADGHTDAIHHLDVSTDGRLAVTASADTTARIWDVATGRCLHVLAGHTKRLPRAVFAPDGRTVATAATDGTVRHWDAETGALLGVLERRDLPVRVVAFSPDSGRLVTGGDDGAIVLHDLTTGETHAIDGHTDNIFSLAFDPSGCCVVSATREGEVVLWDVRTYQRLATLFARPDSRSIFALEFSPKGGELLIGGEFGLVGRLDLTYFDRHIAGNLEHQLDRLERRDGTLRDADGWRAWAAQNERRDASPDRWTGEGVARGRRSMLTGMLTGTRPSRPAGSSGR